MTIAIANFPPDSEAAALELLVAASTLASARVALAAMARASSDHDANALVEQFTKLCSLVNVAHTAVRRSACEQYANVYETDDGRLEVVEHGRINKIRQNV